MADYIFRVTADYINPRTPWIIGTGAECLTGEDAADTAERYKANPKLTNVQVEIVKLGM